MSWSIENPQWFAILLLVIPLIGFTLWKMRNCDSIRKWVILLTRIITLTLLATLLANVKLIREHDHLTVISVVDVSDSVRLLPKLHNELITPPNSTPQVSPDTDLNPTNSEPLTDQTPVEPEILSDPTKPIDDNIAVVRSWLRTAIESSRETDDRAGLVIFDGQPTAISLPAAGAVDDSRFDQRRAEGTDIAHAIRYGMTLFPPDTARRLLLISDGNETTGSALESAIDAAGGADSASNNTGLFGSSNGSIFGIPIDVLPIPYEVQHEILVERIEVPSYTRPDQVITTRIVIRSTHSSHGKLHLWLEDEPVDLNGIHLPGHSLNVTLTPGLNVITTDVRLPSQAIARFLAKFEPTKLADDTLPDNNTSETFTTTPTRGSILFVDGVYEGHGQTLSNSFDAAGFNVKVITPDAIPNSLVAMQAYDLLILQNIAAEDLSEEQHLNLLRYVRDLAGGLIMIGGYDAFGAGGWEDTKIEEHLPVHVQIPDDMQIPTAAIAIVIDRSGSMNEKLFGSRQSKQEIANEGAALAVQTLDPLDWITVISFAHSPRDVVPLQKVDDPTPIMKDIRAIRAEGGTNLLPAMRNAYEKLRNVDADVKHVLCLSDGHSQGTGFGILAAQMKKSGITVSTIAVGDDADLQTMEEIANKGGGTFYPVQNPRILPRIFIKDIRITRRPLIRETEFQPIILPTGATITKDIADSIPPLQGLVLTTARTESTVNLLITSPDDDPILAWWQVGLGRIAAFTSDAHDQWATDWITWDRYDQFWAQLARTIGRPAGSQDFELSSRLDGNILKISVFDARYLNEPDPDNNDTITNNNSNTSSANQIEENTKFDDLQIDGVLYTPDGSSKTIRLNQVGPHTYATEIPAKDTGHYVVALSPMSAKSHRRLGLVVGGATQISGAEFRRLSSNISLLEEIAKQTGGRVLDLNDPKGANLFDRDHIPPTVSVLPIWPILLPWTLVMFLFDVAVRRIAWDGTTLVSFVSRSRFAARQSVQSRNQQAATTLSSLKKIPQNATQQDSLEIDVSQAISTASEIQEPPTQTADDNTHPTKRDAPRTIDPETRRRALDALKKRTHDPKSDSAENNDDVESTTSRLLRHKRKDIL